MSRRKEPTVTTTNMTPADEATAWLESHGFTHNPRINRCYYHRNGNARVEVVDAEAVCFTVYAFTRDRARLLAWQAQFTRAPLPVFIATVTAATT
jgi:hypothetical protein